jgi:hypothetical protein
VRGRHHGGLGRSPTQHHRWGTKGSTHEPVGGTFHIQIITVTKTGSAGKRGGGWLCR